MTFLPAHLRKCVNRRHQGVNVRVGTLGHPCRVKSFRKAVSAVMDDLEHSYSIIDNFHLINNNLISKLVLLQQLTHKIANSVSALWFVLSSRKS